jgi:hypothetical protein
MMHDYDVAFTAAKSLIDAGTYTLVTDAATFVQALAANTDKAEQVARIAYKHKKVNQLQSLLEQ